MLMLNYDKQNIFLHYVFYELAEADIDYVPSMTATPDEHDLKSLKKMIEIMEENDDVQKVYTNCSVDLYDEE